MIPEVHAHFHLRLNNVCNYCSTCCFPEKVYVSRNNAIEEWDPSKGTLDDAVSSYVRMRQIARKSFDARGLDINAGLSALDAEIDLIAISKNGEPPTVEVLNKTAQAIDRFVNNQQQPHQEEPYTFSWLKKLFS